MNNGTINRNGYTLTCTSTDGNGTIYETTGINSLEAHGRVKENGIDKGSYSNIWKAIDEINIV